MISTLLLTILLMIGLFFFIRGSIKDRTEIVTIACQDSQDNILSYLKDYFQKRAYKVTSIDPEINKVNLEGMVSPSSFLAVFLSFLAGCGLFCFALVLSMLFATKVYFFVWLVIFSPLAGFFYWKGANRKETVVFRLDTNNQSSDTIITIQAHRDELIELQSGFPFNYLVKD